MKYSFHIGAVVAENVRMYHDLGIFWSYVSTCNIKNWIAYGGEQHQLMYLHQLTTAYKCLQHICKDLLNFVEITQFSIFWCG